MIAGAGGDLLARAGRHRTGADATAEPPVKAGGLAMVFQSYAL